MAQGFEGQGYRVAVDYPYSGCMLPERFAGDQRVSAIMIEVNRKLYMDQNSPVKLPCFSDVKAMLARVIFGSLRLTVESEIS